MSAHPEGMKIQAGAATAAGRDDAHPLARRLAIAGGVAGLAALLAGAVVLWMRHGVAIFIDTVAAGVATCF